MSCQSPTVNQLSDPSLQGGIRPAVDSSILSSVCVFYVVSGLRLRIPAASVGDSCIPGLCVFRFSPSPPPRRPDLPALSLRQVFCSTRKGCQQAAAVVVREVCLVASAEHKVRLTRAANLVTDGTVRGKLTRQTGQSTRQTGQSTRQMSVNASDRSVNASDVSQRVRCQSTRQMSVNASDRSVNASDRSFAGLVLGYARF